MDIDPRGPRFAALITTVVFALILITGNVWLLAAQALVFAVAVVSGMGYAPYGLMYRWLVRPHLRPPAELEPEAPPRFAQGLGLLISLIGLAGYASGITPLGMAAAAAGLLAAFLNGVFGLCLGCEMYLMIRRMWPGGQTLAPAETDKEVPI